MESLMTADAAAITHDVETVYQAYAAAFNDGDIDRVVGYIAIPYVMRMGGGAPFIVATESERDQLFRKSLNGFKARGWARSDFKILRVWPLSDDHAMLLTDITRRKADGAVLERGRYCYTIRRADDSWRIAAVTDVAEPFLGPGDIARA